MRVGYILQHNNHHDWKRIHSGDHSTPPVTSDAEIVRNDLLLAERAAQQGFDTIWASEHHFTPYLMIPNTLQTLSYIAGRCPDVDVGTAVVVTPWHDPIRVAEEIAMLDIMMGDRQLFVGLGRGAGLLEFQGLGIPMGESRDRFNEALQIIRLALSQESFEFQGQFFKIPRVSMRPRPLHSDLASRLYNAWLSPGSLELAATEGLGPIFAAERKPGEYAIERERYDRLRAEANFAPCPGKVVSFVSVAESEEEALAHLAWKLGYNDNVRWHYGWADYDAYKQVGGYDYYAERGKAANEMDRETEFNMLKEISLWGTPDMVIQKMEMLAEEAGCDEIITAFLFGGMPFEQGEKCLKLFSEKVLPAVKKVKVRQKLVA